MEDVKVIGYKCIHCGEMVACFDNDGDSLDYEQDAWGHIQIEHPEIFEEIQDWDTPDMLEECYDALLNNGVLMTNDIHPIVHACVRNNMYDYICNNYWKMSGEALAHVAKEALYQLYQNGILEISMFDELYEYFTEDYD